MRMPTVFISHGAPVLVLTQTPASQFLRSLSTHVPPPRAILVLSAHWAAPQPALGLSDYTTHAFCGSPSPLYENPGVAPVAYVGSSSVMASRSSFSSPMVASIFSWLKGLRGTPGTISHWAPGRTAIGKLVMRSFSTP